MRHTRKAVVSCAVAGVLAFILFCIGYPLIGDGVSRAGQIIGYLAVDIMLICCGFIIGAVVFGTRR